MDASKAFKAIVDHSMKRENGDYIGADGLLYCGKCHTRKQTRITMPDGTEFTPGCMCKCQIERQEREREEDKRRERMAKVARYRKNGFSDSALSHCRFSDDDMANPLASKVARNFVKNFSDIKKAGKGIMFYGGVGTGKTFIASCIANALIDECRPCLVTNFSRITNALMGTYEGKQEILDSLNNYDLLVIDDFATERNTEYVNEIVYNVIDDRYRSGKPLIVTTNVNPATIVNTGDMTKQRIYSRIMEMCVPIELSGKDRRKSRNDGDLISKLFE